MPDIHPTVFNRPDSDLAVLVARNIRRLRFRRGYTVERLAELADINLLTLDGIEAGKVEPGLPIAWRIAAALDVPFSALIADHAPGGTIVVRKDKARTFVSENLGLASRALFPFDEERGVEFYELQIAPHHHESSEPHATGSSEALYVAQGSIEVKVGREPPHLLAKGDTIIFPADLPHSYRNLGDQPALLFLVMTYAEPPGRNRAKLQSVS